MEDQVVLITVDRPEAGETLTVAVTPGQRVALEFNPADAKFAIEGDDFILTLEDGAQVVLAGLVSAAQGGDTPTIQVAGIDIDADVLMKQVLALAAEAEAEPVQTAAGEDGEGEAAEARDSGGYSNYDDSFGELIAGLVGQGIIGEAGPIGSRASEFPVESTDLPDDLTELGLAELMTLRVSAGTYKDLPEDLTNLDIADLMTLTVSAGPSEEPEDEKDNDSENEDEVFEVAAVAEPPVGEGEPDSEDESDADDAAVLSSGGEVVDPDFEPIDEEILFGLELDEVLTGDDSSTGLDAGPTSAGQRQIDVDNSEGTGEADVSGAGVSVGAIDVTSLPMIAS